MRTIPTVTESQVTELTRTLGHRLMVTPESIYPFMDFDEFLPELVSLVTRGTSRMVGGGHLSPDILIAADRANQSIHETLCVSPFSIDCDTIAGAITSPRDVVYIANPNRITGANVGLNDLRQLIERIPEGILIVDEYYFDYYGITALPLLQNYANVVVLRSFTASFGVGSSDSGFLIGSPTIVEHLAERMHVSSVSATKYKLLSTAMSNDEVLVNRLRGLHDEMLRISTVLTRMGIQNRISAADFLLIRVADVVATGNYLAKMRIPFDNLDGYPQLKGYLRYQVQSEFNNEQLINAFSRMPLDNYRVAGVDVRLTTLKRPSETVVEDPMPVRRSVRETVSEQPRSVRTRGNRQKQVTK
ncbi:MAG: aminotransferase class I/II-fold pyridoxal phosphate-dependent enzyme [bacterium]|nr:aminotransferase class I/II-fold pyridoxal phosphate-dependent enzyme [bacterium]